MNRHLKIAFFIAPLLAIGAYIITGYVYIEPSTNKTPGQLNLIGSCLPTENACTFASSDLELKMVSSEKQGQQQLAVISTQAIQNLSLGLGKDKQFKQFPVMKTDNNRYWQIKLQAEDNIQQYKQIRIAFTVDENSHFAEAALKL